MPIRILREANTRYGKFDAGSIVVGLTASQEAEIADAGRAETLTAIGPMDTDIRFVNQRTTIAALLAAAGVSLVLAIGGLPVTVATVGAAYAFTPTTSGGTAPYTFSIVGGSLPAGLSLNAATGAITGVPSAAGTSAGIVVRVTDSASAVANLAAFSIVVAASGAALAITGTPDTTADVGVVYSTDFNGTGGTAPYTFSVFAGTLPDGLSLNASTGTISGTPTTAGASAGIVVRVTDAVSATANSSAFTITVAAAAADTRPRYWYGPASDYNVNTAAAFAGATPLPGSANGGKTGGPWTPAPSGAQYIWIAALSSAGDITVTESLGSVGFNGAGSAGEFLGTEVSPSTSSITFVHASGTYDLYRSNFLGQAGTPYTLV
jgi:phenylpyruvate tautomerase PptA (4-oxalocrotonate tautomerase family)